jgi:hypothetical protein
VNAPTRRRSSRPEPRISMADNERKNHQARSNP